MKFFTEGIFVDVEGSGQDFNKNPNLQIGAAVMSPSNEGEIIIQDVFDKCIKMRTGRKEKIDKIVKRYSERIGDFGQYYSTWYPLGKIGTHLTEMIEEIDKIKKDQCFEPRCKQQWWDQPQNKKILEMIEKHSEDPELVYTKLTDFVLDARKRFEGIKIISDNSEYDLARISHGLRSVVGNGLEFLDGTYYGFGLDTDCYMNGVLTTLQITKEDFMKKYDVEKVLRSTIKKHENLIRRASNMPFVKHCALYDAIEIGVIHLVLTKMLMNVIEICQKS
jgi:hypothetical protein